MKKTIVTGLSIRTDLLQWVEDQRGDVSRSKFLSKLVEHAYKDSNCASKPNKEVGSIQ